MAVQLVAIVISNDLIQKVINIFVTFCVAKRINK